MIEEASGTRLYESKKEAAQRDNNLQVDMSHTLS
jgi:hypothetical protein